MERAKLQTLIAALETQTTILYLEDLRREIGALARFTAFARSILARPRARPAVPAIPLSFSSHPVRKAPRKAWY